MAYLVNVADLPDPDNPGKTYRESNNEKQHQIPVGTLVEVKYDVWHGHGACEVVHARLWVINHTRDCDGTPLYVLSSKSTMKQAEIWHDKRGGFAEESLTPIEITDRIKDGYEALECD